MREKTPGFAWIAAATALILAALLGVFFIPLKACPDCEDTRLEWAQMGIDVRSIKTSPACRLCDERKKVSLLKEWEYRRRHP